MKKYTAFSLILFTFFITYIFWLFETPSKQVSTYRQYSQFIASISLVALTWINYISTRHSLIDTLFNGLDKSYIYHKYISVISIILIWIHTQTLKIGGFSGKDRMKGAVPPEGFTEPSNPNFFNFLFSGKQLGSISMYSFIALVIFFIIAAKLEYEKWKILHKLLLIPYAFGIAHYYLSSDYNVFSFTAYSLWMNIINISGLWFAIYSIFIYEMIAFKYSYTITDIREVAKDTLEITGISKDKSMKYKPGQFAFMKVINKKGLFPSHPFTMSQAFKDDEIQFTIKSLGDHTENLRNNLVIGDRIAVSGPFGKFNYEAESKHQVWIAGGIGITPFRAFWQKGISKDFTIDLFYAYNNQEEGAYIDELKSLNQNSNFKIHLYDSSISGFLSAEEIEKYLNRNDEYDFYFCGPTVMRKKIEKGLDKSIFKIKEFHYEYF
ncbi:ferric reductase-like transmembrane domain-containing protein [Clostridium sp. SHJSY1]|uniref:ferredoxin reductase family protein n=1 Tax=Clostridium sp. SHJSY1 TaxID=2942483 RepID=UPI0028744ECD|nr:ferric reductase-like transmembrane domain-containing protein [Clostridium sp. SHJSY1]MDS0528558.1 ferric reductase-like transmembrane domain-containing protein [Clostridium sp. SHJSY1]